MLRYQYVFLFLFTRCFMLKNLLNYAFELLPERRFIIYAGFCAHHNLRGAPQYFRTKREKKSAFVRKTRLP